MHEGGLSTLTFRFNKPWNFKVMYNNSNQSNNPTSASQSYAEFYDAVCVLNAVFSLTAFAGNFLVLGAIWSTPNLHKPTNILLLGLSLSDLAVGLLVQPLFIVVLIHEVSREKYPVLRQIFTFIQAFFVSCYNFDAHLGQRGQMSRPHTASQVRFCRYRKENYPCTLPHLASKRAVCHTVSHWQRATSLCFDVCCRFMHRGKHMDVFDDLSHLSTAPNSDPESITGKPSWSLWHDALQKISHHHDSLTNFTYYLLFSLYLYSCSYCLHRLAYLASQNIYVEMVSLACLS